MLFEAVGIANARLNAAELQIRQNGEGANISETWLLSICDSNNSLPKQGGLGWVYYKLIYFVPKISIKLKSIRL